MISSINANLKIDPNVRNMFKIKSKSHSHTDAIILHSPILFQYETIFHFSNQCVQINNLLHYRYENNIHHIRAVTFYLLHLSDSYTQHQQYTVLGAVTSCSIALLETSGALL